MIAIVPLPPLEGKLYAFFTCEGNKPPGPAVVPASICIGGRAVKISSDGIAFAWAILRLPKVLKLVIVPKLANKPKLIIIKTAAPRAHSVFFFILFIFY